MREKKIKMAGRLPLEVFTENREQFTYRSYLVVNTQMESSFDLYINCHL